MKKLIAALVILVVAVLIIWVASLTGTQPPQQPQDGVVTLPSSGTVQNTTGQFSGGAAATTTIQNANTLLLSTVNGATVSALDFIHNGTTVADVENPGSYMLAGSLGYCLANGTCPSGATTTEYNISYSEKTQSFNIALLKEPLGTVRSEAEQFFITALGISNAQACALNYYIGVSYYVNSFYAGKNLGFSFCPGAVVLSR